MKILILIGAPGSGKGTQAKKIVNKYGYKHISTGDMLRSEINQKTSLGIAAKKAIDAGKLVPDDIVIGMMKKALESLNVGGCILDGFPRTLSQAEMLSDVLIKNRDFDVDKVLYIKVSLDSVIKRMVGRLTCKTCGASYHKVFNPPEIANICDIDGSELYVREDDNESVVRKRYKTYKSDTFPVIDYYAGKNLLFEIDGEQDIDIITTNVLNSINN